MRRLYIITGAGGHLGGTIVRYLKDTDCLIRALYLPSEHKPQDERIDSYEGDVTKPQTLDALFEGCEAYETYVIHAAGIISIEGGKEELLQTVNVQGTRNIIAKCQCYAVKRLIYVSSVHAIPNMHACATLREVNAFSKNSVTGIYSRTKAEASRAVQEAALAGLDAVLVHPSGILGPYDCGNNHVVQLISMYLSGKLPAAVHGGYDFVDVRDVAKGCLLAAEKGKAGNGYILSNRYFSIKELLEYVRSIVGGRRKLCLPISIARAFAPLLSFISAIGHTRPLYTRDALDILSDNTHFTHDKATLELGYRPRDMMETIRDTVGYLKGQSIAPENKA